MANQANQEDVMVRVRVFVGGKFMELVFDSYSQFEKWFGKDPQKTRINGGIRVLNFDQLV